MFNFKTVMSKRKLILLLVIFLFFAKVSNGQLVKMQQGIIYKQNSGIRLGSVKVTNKQSHAITQSNLYGLYSIMAAVGDSLELTGAGFQTGSVVITDFLTKVSYLIPSAELLEVMIKGNSLLADLQEVKTGYRNKSVFYTGTPHYYYLFVKPMTFIYENFKSEVIEARKFKRYAQKEVESSEVADRFNDDFIKSYIFIKDADLFTFKLKYWPSLKQINAWSDYDLVGYLRTSYEEFKK